MSFSFARVSSAALSNGSIVFERSSLIAARVGDEWLRYQLRRYEKAGVHVTAAMVRATYFVKDNTITVWNNEPGTTTPGRARATTILRSCL